MMRETLFSNRILLLGLSLPDFVLRYTPPHENKAA
ncbi:MAG: hypothetical protein JWO25_1083 [Alphaproteobacteria bacterium]|nr:hypothetical protein [Alphaproteobacteria bacterium]MDB5722549.1 hypothetical protein [Alphaproteobacteria bacterium]